jgi:hypothetical protein
MKNRRSPNYPSVNLVDAVGLARLVWDRERRSVSQPLVIAEAWGYNGMNGLVRTKLAALKKYGLLEQSGDGLRVSELASRIIQYPAGSPEYRDALRVAALKPDIFRDLLASHGTASEENLRAHLVVKKGFAPAGARRVIKAWRETMSFAQIDDQAYDGHVSPSEPRPMSAHTSPQPAIGPSNAPTAGPSLPAAPGPAQSSSASFELDEGQAVLTWPADLSPPSVAELDAWLTLVLTRLKRRTSSSRIVTASFKTEEGEPSQGD